MKKFLLINILLLSVSFAFAQEIDVNDSVCSFVDERAQFVGGDKAMMKFLIDNIEYLPIRQYIHQPYGRIICRFVVEKDGSITNVEIIRSLDKHYYDNEVIRVVKLMPNWLPAKKDGKVVRSYFMLPVHIHFKN
jgi:protein TonB